ncbi:hypothetical protein AMJ71_02720 [candidate division TA06 bacterium SM1_40]|uniref:Right handed beta helix domain-containing protein n=1 Tax=candidate division TA06 bacterium SM1_40 TaxID=1703773 RepID=A0A0S8JLF3_UNCT6|nr:MAG: hypothetical protein AMJ71_02720 [candidate division TA06 bacterium SM1_40]
MQKRTTQVVAALAVGLGANVSATVLHVPSQYATIQAGVSAAWYGDTVLVANGIYRGDGNRDIDFGGKPIVVMSSNGAEVTIIDCEGSAQDPHRGFHFHSGEQSSSVVQGFTVTNGHARGDWKDNYGGGILCDDSSPTIADNKIIANVAAWSGGGIACVFSSSPAIERNTILGNAASSGGGIECFDWSSPAIIGNRICGNDAHDGWGGGIGCSWVSCPIIEGNTITGNTASLEGGGIFCYDLCAAAIANNAMAGNVAGERGGGISCGWSSHATIHGNTMAHNRADYGGGIFSDESSLAMGENTITANLADSAGGGIFIHWDLSSAIINSILWANEADTDPEIHLSSSAISVNYSDIAGGWPGTGNINADPMFVLGERTDYRLLWDSPCIDAGDPGSLDPDGTRADMGAHYFDQDDYVTLYLTPDTIEIAPGGVLGVTYTAINRWGQPEPFWLLTQVILPSGDTLSVMGPDPHTLPADFTVQRYLSHDVPLVAPLGLYTYQSKIGIPPATLYDEDSFEFSVVQPQ